MEIVLILIFCFLIILTMKIFTLEKQLENKVESRKETKEQIEQKNRKEAFERLMDYSIEKAYESKVK